jgi:hypothetical protein
MGLLFKLNKIFPAYFRWSADYRKSKPISSLDPFLVPCCTLRELFDSECAVVDNYIRVMQAPMSLTIQCACTYLGADLKLPRRGTVLPLTLQGVTARYAWKASEIGDVVMTETSEALDTAVLKRACVFTDAALVHCIIQ